MVFDPLLSPLLTSDNSVMARTKKTPPPEPAAPPAPWSDSVTRFDAYLRDERRPEKTRQSYASDLKAFEAWHEKAMQEQLRDVAQVTGRVLRQWQDDLDQGKPAALTSEGKKPSFTTINRR